MSGMDEVLSGTKPWHVETTDVLDGLRMLPDSCVQCCVTSPPYWGLRDYGVDGQLGLEPTPSAYVAEMVSVFREVRRVLRDDGTCWINIGDSYASSKQLVGIPWMLAFALRDDGWYLRSEIIWHKRAPMPESVTDRPTKAHEQVFLLAKSRKYYYDADAVREDGCGHQWSSAKGFNAEGQSLRGGAVGHTNGQGHHSSELRTGRNLRSVWTLSPESFSGAHFATMPTELARKCLLAGTKADDLVLDPFNGAGTTGVVARRLGLRYIGFELNPDYAAMARQRIRDDRPLFNSETHG